MKIDLRKEWMQIYNDACRIYRDWFYVSNLLHIFCLELSNQHYVN